MSESSRPVKSTQVYSASRPVLLSVLCIFSWVFFGLLSIFFLAGTIKADWIARVTNQYLSSASYSAGEIRVLMVSGLVLHLIGIYGVAGIWNLKKSGYLVLSGSCLIISLYQLFNPSYTVITVLLYILLVIIFGLFIKRYHR